MTSSNAGGHFPNGRTTPQASAASAVRAAADRLDPAGDIARGTAPDGARHMPRACCGLGALLSPFNARSGPV